MTLTPLGLGVALGALTVVLAATLGDAIHHTIRHRRQASTDRESA
jgi:hypothetical protein